MTSPKVCILKTWNTQRQGRTWEGSHREAMWGTGEQGQGWGWDSNSLANGTLSRAVGDAGQGDGLQPQGLSGPQPAVPSVPPATRSLDEDTADVPGISCLLVLCTCGQLPAARELSYQSSHKHIVSTYHTPVLCWTPRSRDGATVSFLL